MSETKKRKVYVSYEEARKEPGPYIDPYDLHEHRYVYTNKEKVCTICNKRDENLELSKTKITNAYELDKRILKEFMRNNGMDVDTENELGPKVIKYDYNVM